MKQTLKKNNVLFIIAILSVLGLGILSYLTVLNFSYENEERYIATCNEGITSELETSMKYGKSLESYYGIESVLKDAAEMLGNDCILCLTGKDGEILAASLETTVNMSEYRELKQDILDPDGERAGSLYTYYPNSYILESLLPARNRAIAEMPVFLLFLIAVCTYLSFARNFSTHRLINVVLILIIAEGVFFTFNYQGCFHRAAEKNARSVASYVASSLNDLLEKGVALEDISDLDDYLIQEAAQNPSIQEIIIFSDEEEIKSEHYFAYDLFDSGKKLGIVFQVDEQNIRQNVMNMILTFAATIILLVIIMRESLVLSEIDETRKNGQLEARSKESYETLAKAIRYGNFLSVTFDYICLSFSALMIREWNQGIFGISPAFAAALSISICSVADILGMLSMPSIGKKIKPKRIMLISALLLLVCNAACFFTTSTLIVVLMRFFFFFFTSGVKQVRNTIISQGYTTEEQRNANLTANNNGVIGGILCGMGLGSVLAGVFGYGSTFLAAAIGNFLYLGFESRYLPWNMLAENTPHTTKQDQRNLAVRISSLLKSPSAWKVMVLVVVPQYFLLMVIVCLIPAHIQGARMPGVVLTYSNLINGLAGLYLGERLFQLLGRRFKLTSIMGMMLLVGAIAMFILNIPVAGILFVLISAALTGFVDGIGTPVATDLFMENRDVLAKLDETESLMLYSLIGSGVMTAAPFILEFCAHMAVWLILVALILTVAGVYVLRS